MRAEIIGLLEVRVHEEDRREGGLDLAGADQILEENHSDKKVNRD
jgi:hypothetical protein